MVYANQCKDELDTIRFVVQSVMRSAQDRHALINIAHIPFEVTLPSVSNPVFTVRDFGTGLLEQEILGNFGSISTTATAPLQYSPIFYITSHTETVMRSAYIELNIDEHNANVTILESVDKPDFMRTGLNIAVFVNQPDISRFEQEVITQAQKFNAILIKDGITQQYRTHQETHTLLTN